MIEYQNDSMEQRDSTGQQQNKGSQQNQGNGEENPSWKKQDERSQPDNSDASVEDEEELSLPKKERSRTTPYAGNSNELNQDDSLNQGSNQGGNLGNTESRY